MGPEEIIEILGLKPLHPEGGYYRENYRSPLFVSVPDGRLTSQRSLTTTIYYLLTPDSFSAIHRLLSDEIYHFYLGDPVEMILLYPDGSGRKLILGHQINEGQQLQFVVPAGVWQGAILGVGGRYALLGTTVSPGYDQRDFCLGNINLAEKYPMFADQISRFIRQ